MTHDMLMIEKIQQIQKDLIVLVSGNSRNIVLAKLRNFDELENNQEEVQMTDANQESPLPTVCEFQNLAPFCLSKKPLMIVPILPKEKKDRDQQPA